MGAETTEVLQQESPENRASVRLLTLCAPRGLPYWLILLLVKILQVLHGCSQPWSVACISPPALPSHYGTLHSARNNTNIWGLNFFHDGMHWDKNKYVSDSTRLCSVSSVKWPRLGHCLPVLQHLLVELNQSYLCLPNNMVVQLGEEPVGPCSHVDGEIWPKSATKNDPHLVWMRL